MPTFKIKSKTLKGKRVEFIDRAPADRRLAEIRKSDPQAKLLTIPDAR